MSRVSTSLEQITDKPDPRLEPARLAPSAVNGQPWYFAHEGETIHIYCNKKGSPLDAGIALAHLYVANMESFRFSRQRMWRKFPDMRTWEAAWFKQGNGL